jgi:bifunctional DNA-binding transcriptional regulator/antitoxin component of YhaV-PrlF toxin-antitoxin module
VIVSVSSKGQIVLPMKIRRMDGIKTGQKFKIERLDKADYHLTRQRRFPNEGLVDLLLACPVKGFFVRSPRKGRKMYFLNSLRYSATICV